MISSRTEALRYLDSLIGSGIRPGLERMRSMLDAAGRPERSVPAIIVGGTNGKGSTAAMLSSICTVAGYRTGLYTSPHLIGLEERWRVNETPVSEADLVRAVRRLVEVQDGSGIVPTYFEALTLLAFFIFEEAGCEVAILEVGMGGRLDATNVADPIVSVITRIDLDHQEWLGDSLSAIAVEKMGITRAGRDAVVSAQVSEARAAMSLYAANLGVRLQQVEDLVQIESFSTGLRGSEGQFRSLRASYRISAPLRGAHQASNIATAIRAAEVLAGSFPSIDREAIARGIRETYWRARLELFELQERLVLVDGAHNPAGAAAAGAFASAHLCRPRRLVFGVLEDKDAGAMLAQLAPHFDAITLTRPDSERGRSPSELLAQLSDFPGTREIVEDPVLAVRRVLEEAEQCSLICGSLYLAGTAVRELDRIATTRT